MRETEADRPHILCLLSNLLSSCPSQAAMLFLKYYLSLMLHNICIRPVLAQLHEIKLLQSEWRTILLENKKIVDFSYF